MTDAHEKRRASARAASDPPSPIDQPDHHGFFMMGRDSLYLSHMPMFTMEDHMYQVVLRAQLPPDVMQTYLASKQSNPATVFNLINVADDPFTLPEIQTGAVSAFTATIYAGYSNANHGTPGPVLVDNVPVTVLRVVHFRHFDFDFPYPTNMTYILYGSGSDTFLSHYISRDPDFQHIVTLPSPPDWLSASQIDAGVNLNIVGMPSTPIPCSNPLTQSTYQVQFQGWPGVPFPIEVGEGSTYWFSTDNLLNSQDPCAGG